MKRQLLFLFTVLLLVNAHAQRIVPGYMGKRFTIGYNFSISPNFSSVLYSASLDYSGPMLRNGLRLSYVASSRREIAIGVKLLSKRIDNSYYRANTEGLTIPDFERFNMLEYSFSWRRFPRSKFAPLGAYNRWEISYCSGSVKYDAYQAQRFTDNKIITYDGGSADVRGAAFTYSLGTQRIFEDKFPLDYGISASLYLLTGGSNSSYGDHLASDAIGSINATPTFNVHVGIGFLAF
jgi:hypothetical protein